MAVFRFERSYRIYEIFGRHDSYLDGLQCGKEMETEVLCGSKNIFINPLWKKEKVKQAKRKVVLLFYSLDRWVLVLFRDMGREFLWGRKKSSSISCGRKKRQNKQIGWSGRPFLTARLRNCSPTDQYQVQGRASSLVHYGRNDDCWSRLVLVLSRGGEDSEGWVANNWKPILPSK